MKMKKQIKIDLPKQTMIAIALAVGGLVLGLAGYLIAVSPEKGKIGVINSQIGVARASLITAEQAPPKVKVAPAKAVDLFRLTEAMPDTDDIPGVLIALSQLAKKSKVSLIGVTPSPAVTATGYSQIPLSVSMTGTFGSVMSFLTAVRRTATVNGDNIKVRGRLFVATGVTIQSTAKTAVNATVSLNAFSYAVAAPATTDPTSTDPAAATAAPATTTTGD